MKSKRPSSTKDRVKADFVPVVDNRPPKGPLFAVKPNRSSSPKKRAEAGFDPVVDNRPPMGPLFKLPGSYKDPVEGAKVLFKAPSDDHLEVTVRLRPENALPKASQLLGMGSAPLRTMTRAEFDQRHGASAADIAAVKKFARAHKLSVARESSARRTVILGGTVEQFDRAFGVDLQTYEYPNGTGTYRGRTGYIKIPKALKGIIEGVFGLDNRHVARRKRPMYGNRSGQAANGARAFDPNQVAKLYNFPADADGSGQVIGIIELGGGYRPSDLEAYFGRLGLPVPTVVPVSVDGATNSPSTADSADGEVALDIEVVGACAPGAKIVVYFSTNDMASDGFIDALTKAVHDDENKPTIISISWGGPEDPSAQGFQQQFDQALQEAAMLGVTVCVASGDDGAADMPPRQWDGKAHVDFPASSPFALACGGTRLIANGSAIASESVWNQHKAEIDANTGPDGSFGAGGGGVSGTFPLPAYQGNNVPRSLNPAGFRGRGVPDVAGDADPASGYNIQVDGQSFPIGGTSAVAPLWAALIARVNQKLGGAVGFINPQIYALAAKAGFNDITVDDNKCTYKHHHNVGYAAGVGWDACTGLGTPIGAALASLLKLPTQAPAPTSRRAGAKPSGRASAARSGRAAKSTVKRKAPKKAPARKASRRRS
jgi:kumamolisin